MTTKSFDCPNCGAPLDYEEGGAVTIRCTFCNSSVIVPEELRPKKATAPTPTGPPLVFTTVSNAPPIKVQNAGRGWGCFVVGLVLFIVLVTVVPIILAGAGIWATFSTVATSVPGFSDIGTTIEASLSTAESVFPVTPETPAFAEQSLAFGSEGIGPGMLSDARSIAVDGAGNVYVGDYIGGRIQIFDQNGNYQTLWNIDPDIYLAGLAATQDGTLFIAQNGDIQRFNGKTGELLGDVKYKSSESIYFGDLTVTTDNRLIALADDLMVIFDGDGQTSATVAIEDVPEGNDFEQVTVDGTGRIYVLGQTLARGQFNDVVFVFTPEGQYLSQFGGSGDEDGLFRAPDDIAVDGLGRVYVSDIFGIQVFDSNGRYLTEFETEGVVFGMTFRAPDELWAVSNANKVFQFTLPSQ